MKLISKLKRYWYLNQREVLVYSLATLFTFFLFTIVIITFPKSDQDIKRFGNTAYIPYGSTLVISAGKSTMFVTPTEEKIERKLLFFTRIAISPVQYSDNTIIHWGPFFHLKIKKVPGGIELTKPWFARFR